MVKRNELQEYLDDLLEIAKYKDYGPNGLQVEGNSSIKCLAFAVSATEDSILQAISRKAEGLIVHHGLFWNFHGTRPLTGAFGKRILPLVRSHINLFAYHLPLDAHLDVGNARLIADHLGLKEISSFGDYEGMPTGVKGICPSLAVLDLKDRLEKILSHPVILSSFDQKASVSSIGIITGGAGDDWPLAVDADLDAYITGEIKEHHWHEAQEAGIHLLAGGHHATERFGVQELMRRIEDDFDVECFFIDSPNPV